MTRSPIGQIFLDFLDRLSVCDAHKEWEVRPDLELVHEPLADARQADHTKLPQHDRLADLRSRLLGQLERALEGLLCAVEVGFVRRRRVTLAER